VHTLACSICFPSFRIKSSFIVKNHLAEVCTLSCRVFPCLLHYKTAFAFSAIFYPQFRCPPYGFLLKRENFGLTKFYVNNLSDNLGYVFPPIVFVSVCFENKAKQPTIYLLVQVYQQLSLASHHSVY
jgi:hypothetical protein